MSFKKIDQKEYLKKYLSGDKQKKKKKKNKYKDQHRSHQEKVKIIDDDLHAPENIIDDELYGEDAPQIVGEFTEELASGNDRKCKWRSIAIKEEAYDKKYNQYGTNGHSVSDSKKIAPQSNANLSPDRKYHKTKTHFPDDSDCYKKISRTGGSSKERRKQKNGDSHVIRSPSRRTYRSHSRENSQHKVSSFQSQNQTRSTLPVKRCSLSPDQSPPRKKSHVFESYKSQSKTSETYDRSSSGSPKPRSFKKPLHQPDLSPQRMQTSHKLIRSKRNDNLQARKSNTLTTFPNSPIKKEKHEDSDLSPPRRVGEDSDLSPPRRVGEQLSLFDKRSRRNRSSLHVKREELSPDSSPQRKSYSSKQRRSRWASPERLNSQSLSPPPTHKPKISSKTLDGKRAGLQDSKALKTEMDELRRQEELMIANMPSELSGRNGEVQVRNTRRRGERARNAAIEDTDKQRQKDAHEKYKQELYDRWGKGLKQIEDYKSRKAEIDYESNKPFARHRDDEDLDRHLREKEHPDDPMLEYMRQKRKEREKIESLPKIPVYEGSYPENRFGIRPGYRWDGVDRSNGYEKKWFDMQNAKRALRDEAYKYSVEDM